MFELHNIKTKFAEMLFNQISMYGTTKNKFQFEIEPTKESWILQIEGTFNAGHDHSGNLQVWDIDLKAVFCFADFEAVLGEMYVEQLKTYVTE